MIKTTENKYDGVVVDTSTLPKNIETFKDDVSSLLESIKNKQLIWIKISIQKSEFIPILTNLGFEFHHCDEKNIMLVKRIEENALIPTTKNYIVGVGAVVIKDGQLLVIKDRFQAGYKLPGGHVDKNESLKDALVREVFEETGVEIKFESIMNLGHFKNGQFGESNLYIVCTAKALSSDIMVHDASEIIEAKWMGVTEFLESSEVNNYNKSVVQAAINNKELKLTEQQVKLRVTEGEVFY